MIKTLFPKFILLFLIVNCSSPDQETTSPPEITQYTLSVSAGNGGTVSTSGGSYTQGQSVSVTATPESEYVFVNWSNGSTDNPLSVTVNSNQTITANFEKRKYPLTITIQGEGTVREEVISYGKSTPTEYNSGTVVRLTAEPTGDWVFEEWTGSETETTSEITITLDEPKTVNVRFMRYFNYNQPSYFLQSPENIWIDYHQTLENNNIDYGSIAYGCPEVYADFNSDGYLDWMTAPSYYQQENGPMSIQLFTNQLNNIDFVIDNFIVDGEVTTWNARKALLGDFNNDSLPDIVYAEQGVDIWPTEGSPPSILLSSENGYQITNLSESGFFSHTGASGDIDNDGDLDIIMSSMHFTVVYLNNGNGTFVEKRQYSNDLYSNGNEDPNIIEINDESLQNGVKGFISMELYDINKDGFLDLIAGGDENNSQSRIYFGNGSNFSYNRSKLIPFTDPWRAALDFDFFDYDNDGDDEIIIPRYKNVYEGYFIELVDLDEDGNYIIDSNRIDNSDAEIIRWPVWLRVQDIDNNGNVDIFSNDKGNLGYGEFRWEWNGTRFVKRF